MKKLIIVEDNRHLLLFLEQHLRKAGYEVVTARSGLAAVDLLAEQTADIIFIDYFLPNLNADRLCQIIRRMEHLKNAYLVVMSAAASELDIDAASIGANGIIAKGTFKETARLMISAVEKAEAPSSTDSEERPMGLESVHPRQMTKELLAQNRHMQAMLDSISEGIIEIYQKRVVYANPACEKLFGVKQAKLLASYLPDLFDKKLRSQLESIVKPSEKDAPPTVQTQTIQLTGKTLWMKRLPFLGDDDTIILLITDITERVRAEKLMRNHQQQLEALVEKRTAELKLANERLRQIHKIEAIGTIAGSVAHDLNNILSGLVSYPDLILLEIPEESPLKMPLLTIKKSGEKAAAIVQDLLTLVRRGSTTGEVANLNMIISEYLKSPEYLKLKSHHIDVNVGHHLQKALFNIICSPVHLSKTLMNLVTNAAEAMPKGGKIHISTKNEYIDRVIKGYEEIPKGEYVTLTVTDTGIGISSVDMQRIFEPFYTRKRMGRSGTGLGMAVIWGSVKDHKGYIDIKSTEGKGSIFKLYFPASRREPAKVDPPIGIESYMGNGESVLVVDDEPAQREIASGILKKLGYKVCSVPSGEKAVDYVNHHSVDLIVLDMIMEPGIDGLETYKRIIKVRPNQSAIIASGFSETARIKGVKKLGVGQYIKKPYTLEKIGIAVRTELDKQSN